MAIYLVSACPASNRNPIVEITLTNDSMGARVPTRLVIVKGLLDIARLVLVAYMNVGHFGRSEAVGRGGRANKHSVHGECSLLYEEL